MDNQIFCARSMNSRGRARSVSTWMSRRAARWSKIDSRKLSPACLAESGNMAPPASTAPKTGRAVATARPRAEWSIRLINPPFLRMRNASSKASSGSLPQAGKIGGRDSGGTGIAGTPYMIGTGAQPEIFIPNTNGTFIPNADKKIGGTVYNIVINNPKKETAENSIRSALKNLSYTGAAA